MDWALKGYCHINKLDRGIFFPEHSERAKINEARKACFRCTVRVQCLEYALDNDEYGIWGGTTQYERDHHTRVELLRRVS